MNHSEENRLDKLSKKVMKTMPLDSPSFDFTNQVMREVIKLSEHKTIEYKPLISKKMWFIIVTAFIALLCFVLSGNGLNDKSWFSFMSNIKVREVFSNLSISSTALYAIVLFGIMLFIQLPLLKHYFNKRLDV